MGFPYPRDPNSCRCFSTLSKHVAEEDPEVPLVDANGVAINGVVINGVLKGPLPSSKAPTPTESSITARKKPTAPPTEGPDTLSPPGTSTELSPPDSDASSDEEGRAVGTGTDLALSIGHNLLMLTKYRGGGTYLDFCDKEVRKVMQAPPGIQECILSPLHRPDKKDPYLGQGARRHPSNPRNTLRGLATPTLGRSQCSNGSRSVTAARKAT
jgi:hypothetical protein